MSDTSETDSAFQKGMSCKEVFEFARKLERERNEAREALKHIAEYGTEEINAAVEHPLDNGIPERHEVYIWKNGKYELDP
jgi:hypothetical protein